MKNSPASLKLTRRDVAIAALATGSITIVPAHAEANDVPLAELLAPTSLPDFSIGAANAPVTIVEYASLGCRHCAEFHKTMLPQLKAKYVSSGTVRIILREFPLDDTSLAAAMLVRCAGPMRHEFLTDAFFNRQSEWFADGLEPLRTMALSIGFTDATFKACLSNQQILDGILVTRKRANEQFKVDSTPTLFVNGKRIDDHTRIESFDALIGSR